MSNIRTGIKMRVTPKQSRKVQEICFENGIGWVTDKKIDQLDNPFLFIDDYVSFMYEDQEEFFDKDKNEEVSAELFIITKGTCIESEATTENNNKGEIMEEVKLECLVKGYEGTYFEVGQVWETRYGNIKARVIEILTDGHYPIVCEYYNKAEDRNFKFNLDKYGNFIRFSKNRPDIVKLITAESTPSEEPQPKTLSEYLKENNAYESFVENSVNYFLQHIPEYRDFSSDNRKIEISGVFYWRDTEQGSDYWLELNEHRPKNLEYDMNEIIFAEVDRRILEQKVPTEPITTEEFDQILEQKPLKRYMVFVEGKNTPRYIHDSYDSAETEAKRLSTKMVGSKVSVVEIIKEFKSKIIVEEI